MTKQIAKRWIDENSLRTKLLEIPMFWHDVNYIGLNSVYRTKEHNKKYKSEWDIYAFHNIKKTHRSWTTLSTYS